MKDDWPRKTVTPAEPTETEGKLPHSYLDVVDTRSPSKGETVASPLPSVSGYLPPVPPRRRSAPLDVSIPHPSPGNTPGATTAPDQTYEEIKQFVRSKHSYRTPAADKYGGHVYSEAVTVFELKGFGIEDPMLKNKATLISLLEEHMGTTVLSLVIRNDTQIAYAEMKDEKGN